MHAKLDYKASPGQFHIYCSGYLVWLSKANFGCYRSAMVKVCSTFPPQRMYDGREEGGQNTYAVAK